MTNVETDILETLMVFLSAIIMKNKREDDSKWMTKIITIARAIITAVRPKSFFSPLLIGIGALLNRKQEFQRF